MTSNQIRPVVPGGAPIAWASSTPPAPGQGHYPPPTVPGYGPPGGPPPVGPGGPGGPGPRGPRPGSGKGRGLPIVLGVAIVVLVVAVLALSFTLLSGDDGDDVATRDGDDVEAVSTTTASTTTVPITTASTAPPQTAPPQTAPPQTAPPQTAPPRTAPPTTLPPADVGSRAELEATLAGYINALDSGSLDAAYSYVGPGLAAQDGWSHGEFIDFWAGRLSGAGVISIDSVSTSTGVVSATVDYYLAGGGGSREAIRVVVGSDLLLSDYEVVSSSQL